MAWFRLVFGALLLSALGCFAASMLTGDLRWRRRGKRLVALTLTLALSFFGVLLLGTLGAHR